MITDTTAGLVDDAEARRRRHNLADELEHSGRLRTPVWRDAFTAVFRHVFVPRFFRCNSSAAWPGNWVAVSHDDPATRAEWLDAVYRDQTLITDLKDQLIPAELGGGRYPVATSSSTMPGLMLSMLEDLDVADGMDVMEIGTGTGYNAALLCARLGEDHVTSVDIDPELVNLARNRLFAHGFHPRLAAADGEAGHPPGALYHRVIATCSVDRVPPAWIAQTRPGGKILVNIRGPIMRGALAVLEVGNDNEATGRFLPGYAGFMELRHDPDAPFARTPLGSGPSGDPEDGSTSLDPALLQDGSAFGFFAQLSLPGAQVRRTTADDEDTGTRITTPDGSQAVAWQRQDRGRYLVIQSGPRRLWNIIEHAHQQWTELGRPTWTDFRVIVRGNLQRILLDSPEGTPRA
jgi:methyltransferase of ATP-grasp peptide maturase system